MIHLRVKNDKMDILMNSFPEDFVVSENEEIKSDKVRYIRKNTNFGILEVLMINEQRVANSNKVFKSFVISLENITENTINRAREIADDYLHNIVKIHGNQKNILERCILGAEGKDNYNDFVEAVKSKIKNNPNEFSEDICALVKETRLVDYHIGGYNLFHNLSPKPNITENHNLKKFLLGLSHLFFDSFSKNNIVLSLHNISEDFKCSFEYETFNVAMHCFIENLVKYSKPYTTVTAHTDDNFGKLIFDMESIRIEKQEVNEILKRGISGSNVPSYLQGNGIGMYQLKKAIDRSGIKLEIHSDYSNTSKINDINYTKNTFIFCFPKYSI
jgi:hypothetical protein